MKRHLNFIMAIVILILTSIIWAQTSYQNNASRKHLKVSTMQTDKIDSLNRKLILADAEIIIFRNYIQR